MIQILSKIVYTSIQQGTKLKFAINLVIKISLVLCFRFFSLLCIFNFHFFVAIYLLPLFQVIETLGQKGLTHGEDGFQLNCLQI